MWGPSGSADWEGSVVLAVSKTVKRTTQQQQQQQEEQQQQERALGGSFWRGRQNRASLGSCTHLNYTVFARMWSYEFATMT